MNFFSSRPSSPNPLRLSLTSLGKLSLLAGALFSAGALSASEDRFTTVTDLDRWINKSQEHTYSGSVEGSHSGNVFTFALTDGDEISKLDFYGASDAAVLNGNRLVFMQGDYRTDDGEHSFEAAHGATKEANGNAVVIEGGNFLPPLSGYPSDHLISIEAAQGVSDMSGNRIVVTGGDFSGHVRFTAANNTVTENDVTDADFTLADNIIEITGGNFRTNADVEVAYSEIGTLTRNRLEIKGLQNGRLFMAYAANTERGNAYENEIVIDESSLYVQSDFFTASAGSPAPSTLENNILTVTNSTIDSSSFGAAMNASGDVVGNHVEIANTTLKESSGSNLFVYGGLHVGYGGLDGRIAGNVIRLENVTLDLKENQTAFFIAGQLSASEGCELTDNAVEIVGDGNWDKRLSKARFVGAQRFGGTEQNDIHDNALRLYGWRGAVSSIKGFDRIELNAVPWEANGTVLKVDMTPYETWDGTVTDETQIQALEPLLALLDSHPEATVEIVGWADPTGTVAANRIVTQRRADNVAGYLIRKGFPAGQISARGAGIDTAEPDYGKARRAVATVRILVEPAPQPENSAFAKIPLS